MTRIAIVGPGSVGGFFAAHLAAAGRDVVACARRPFDRYVVESETAPVEGAPAHVVTSPGELGESEPVDWVLVGVKAHQTEGAAPWLDRLCGPETSVVVMQNGVEGESRLAPYANGGEVVAAVVYCGASLPEPGHVRHTSTGWLIVPERPISHRLAELFDGTGAGIRISDDYATEAWRKLGINVMANGVTALTRQPMRVFRRPDVSTLGFRLLDECWTVARAEGASLTSEQARVVMERMAQAGDERSSTLQDRLVGRPTEHDALYGAVIRAGARHGIATPYAETVSALLAAGDADTDG